MELELDTKQLKKTIFFALSGNFIEIFEFSLFGIFASVISNIFFSNSIYGTLYSLIILSTGFLARPLGAVIFGHIGDRYGRRPALLASIALMSLATFGIGVLPSPHQIGIIAAFILLFLRIIQGISCGGEYIGIVVYLFEHFPHEKRGIAGAIAAGSGMTGTLVAIIVSYFSTSYLSFEWGWRIPFLIAPIFGLSIMYLRRQFAETTLFKKNMIEKEIPKYPLKLVFQKYLSQFFSTIFIGGFNGILTFTLIVYLNIFVLKYTEITFSPVLGINFIAVSFFICATIAFGLAKDRWQLSTSYCLSLFSILTLIFSPVIYLALLQGSYTFVLFGEIILALLAGSFSACCNMFMCQAFPSSVRYSGIALGYTIGTSLLGGTAPAFCHMLIETTKEPLMPAVYLAAGAVLSLASHYLFSFKNNNKASC